MTPQLHHSIPAMVPPANCFTVLVIDDIPANRVLLRKTLKSSGYAVVEAGDGAEALDLLRSRAVAPDLILTDVEMPVLDGVSLVRCLRRLDGAIAAVPVIVASGNADGDMEREALEAGANLFLTKPFDLAQLRAEIARLLRESCRSRAAGSPARSAAGLPGNRLRSPLSELKHG